MPRYTVPTSIGPAVPLVFVPTESLIAWRDYLTGDEGSPYFFVYLPSEREILPAINAEIAYRVWCDGPARELGVRP